MNGINLIVKLKEHWILIKDCNHKYNGIMINYINIKLKHIVKINKIKIRIKVYIQTKLKRKKKNVKIKMI